MRNGLALVEILTVVVVLGILAMIAMPRYLNASGEAREATLAKDLRMVREQIEMFKCQHRGILPGQDDNEVVLQMTGRTDIAGFPAANGVCGPYMRIFPTNPFTETNTVRATSSANPGIGDQGWYYNISNGWFCPNDPAHMGM